MRASRADDRGSRPDARAKALHATLRWNGGACAQRPVLRRGREGASAHEHARAREGENARCRPHAGVRGCEHACGRARECAFAKLECPSDRLSVVTAVHLPYPPWASTTATRQGIWDRLPVSGECCEPAIGKSYRPGRGTGRKIERRSAIRGGAGRGLTRAMFLNFRRRESFSLDKAVLRCGES